MGQAQRCLGHELGSRAPWWLPLWLASSEWGSPHEDMDSGGHSPLPGPGSLSEQEKRSWNLMLRRRLSGACPAPSFRWLDLGPGKEALGSRTSEVSVRSHPAQGVVTSGG